MVKVWDLLSWSPCDYFPSSNFSADLYFENLWVLLVIFMIMFIYDYYYYCYCYYCFFLIYCFSIYYYYSIFEKWCIETSLAGSKRTPPLAGKLQSPSCAGWQCVDYAGRLTPILHDGWLRVLFPETLARWEWRAGNFFPAELNINEDWRFY